MDPEVEKVYDEVKATSEKLTSTTSGVNQVYKEFREHAKDFYFRLSLLSGGILSLSVTYLGYLSSKQGLVINYGELLLLGWFFLVVCLIASMYRNHFYTNFGHWQVLTDSNEARLASEEALLKMAEKFPDLIANLRTKEEFAAYVALTKRNIAKIKSAIPHTKSKEKWAERFWLWSQQTAHVSFVLGLISIVLFAALNLPVQVKFTLLSFLYDWF